MVRWTFINAVGGTVISALTLAAASYLLYSLWRQGTGKLRVRLLIGMVVSDLLLGLIALVMEAKYLSDNIGFRTGSAACNALGFLLTVTLFTQHLWTLAIAMATFLLLKYPLARATSVMERWAWTATPLIWIISFLHSGLWWRYVGWASSGNLCYYGSSPITSANGLDGRDLVQFIPRALVFIVIVGLYSTLYSFLRRPDTIQLSSHFTSGGTNSDPHKGVQMGKVFRRFAGGRGASEPVQKPAVNPEAPWEQLEFVHVGNGRAWGSSPVLAPMSGPQSAGLNRHDDLPTASRPPSPHSEEPPSFLDDPQLDDPVPVGRVSTTSTDGFITPNPSQRPSETDTLVTASSKYATDSPPADDSQRPHRHRTLSQVTSVTTDEDSKSVSLDLDSDEMEIMPEGQRKVARQTLREFFEENRAPGLEDTGGGYGNGSNGKGAPMSATAYFNRQASLLMLYFPLAYMVVFSMSLVRLIYGMIHQHPNPVLTVISSWMVLSVGLIDGLVYGLAEFLVRRRVRKKMPDRIGRFGVAVA